MAITLHQLRRFALARSLFAPTTLPAAIAKLGFVQADPIRAPARAQDLTLRHRVKGYRAGDLERRYPKLDVEEDFFVNYGFVPRSTQALMHPRVLQSVWTPERAAQAKAVLDFARAHGVVHPREVDTHFAHGSARNWFGGSSNASTQLLDDMHYRGLLHIAGRVSGVRTYAVRDGLSETAPDPAQAMDALVDVIVNKYAPLPERSLGELISHLRGGTPQWAAQRAAAFQRAKQRLASARVDGVTWYWPADETPTSRRLTNGDMLRLLAPFDPVVWDRRRFELFWGWAYRFEAYTPAPKRVRGYYALPLLWREQVIGWGNLAVRDNQLDVDLGYVAGSPPTDAAFAQALEEELARLRTFLALPETPPVGLQPDARG
ncbi:DNA glycosylase AlkZ-like family protein [Rhodoferax sp. U11-2br]|uniref:DNA glycosylase AlkZ-like family protein n=1 Tax=Rhodoferax sp. U11-2br TaxID=2838878 RepID=UPI001BED1DCF|nr:crosslink repair DNA glycosylase YcaQ family protein [Rhodoferax sp. U11-2br]MBT3068578.1 winged helix DNA-binding domain-containing protein [Rhodoferax sp. U11-2br]